MSDLNGILVVDKPSSWTSHDVVQKTKNLLGGPKVGHTGTLDPFATGVLVLLVGKATKQAKFFENDDKRYHAEITFGYATDTFDSTGRVTSTGDPDAVNREELKSFIQSLEGESEQIPPMYSAVKVGGKKLYQLARAGKEIERKPRKIVIQSIEAHIEEFPKIQLNIHCSKGTYIRTIADQLGTMAGCPACLTALRRTSSGTYTLDDAVVFLPLAEAGDSDVLKKAIISL